MASYFQNALDQDILSESEQDTELYAKNINITGIFQIGSKTFLAFEFLVIYKDASRWVRDIIEIGPGVSVEEVCCSWFREKLIKFVEEQRNILRNRSAKLSTNNGR